MAPSPRDTFDRNLKGLVDHVLILGSLVDQALRQSIDALQRHDHSAARRIYENDQFINEKRYSIESACISLIATQQPMARDIRFLAAILEIITELERIGDYAKGISKVNLLLTDDNDEPGVYYDLNRMTDLALAMLRQALDAFVAHDVSAAHLIPADDDEVDRLYNVLYAKLTRASLLDIYSLDRANHLMWAAHNLERAADRVSNICERIIYVFTGEMKELD